MAANSEPLWLIMGFDIALRTRGATGTGPGIISNVSSSSMQIS
jgi:hypothetical protein